MPIINPSITSGTYKTDTLVSCESFCCHCCLSSDLEHILNLKAEKIKLTLNGFNSTETIASEEDDLTVTSESIRKTPFCSGRAYVKDDLNLGSVLINNSKLPRKYSHLEHGNLEHVERIKGQDVYEYILPLD